MQCNYHGIGRVGIDFWYCRKDSRGRMYQLTPRGGQFTFNASTPWFFAPGPKGHLPTVRSEAFREGLQVREAMAFLRRTMGAVKKSDPALAKRIHALLDRRARDNMLSPNRATDLAAVFNRARMDKTRDLFALCAEAAARR
jgi:hypothetical protein